MNKKCKKEIKKIDDILAKSCEEKVNTLKPCDEKEADCPCSSPSGSSAGKVDLVILVDSSGSMSGAWNAINEATEKLEDAIKEKCGKEARITKLNLDDSNDPSTSGGYSVPGFLNYEKYLRDTAGYAGSLLTNNDDPDRYETEQGAKGIADLSSHFDWIDGACRSILYVSDEWLDGSFKGSPSPANDIVDKPASAAAISIAVNAANTNNVTLFAHLINSIKEAEHYKLLTESTGGSAHIGDAPSPKLYIDLVSEAACKCGKGCKEIKQPKIMPCISISWGDSNCDSLETDDFEILCISVCNCYSNIAFNNFNISRIEITDSDSNVVANLPDGTPSIQAVPIGPVCFGTIAPCEEGKASCVNREFVINTRGAKDGEYQVILHGVCFDVNFNYHQDSCFKFELCKS